MKRLALQIRWLDFFDLFRTPASSSVHGNELSKHVLFFVHVCIRALPGGDVRVAVDVSCKIWLRILLILQSL